ncbi:membrane fusion protein, cobalt-zinc-cadmium efflux system [Singulisphaera sp. GP187]|uniref:efflux RND transporter periplasmic adaptor subunit n=1 Tax=Singulisphaera sp. GP187 TaxID=1882752 RepID=UPI0009299F79|nr:efflux RND transporter periplasmic adaptor subunit [Singulisphaera sp. GP187]SIN74696.1 membrane fusion protein, cobalt-zinc-cadmium efflux system [Singulisphaera sp. GP187]
MKMKWTLVLAIAATAGFAAWMYFDRTARGRALAAWHHLASNTAHAEETRPPSRTSSVGVWDGILTVTSSRQEALGLRVQPAKEQAGPVELRLSGTTDYDPATLTIVRTQFESRVDRVHMDLGSVVKKGDAILELFSNTLAQAKSDYEMAVNQWRRDKKILDYKSPLAKAGTLPGKELIEIENDEAKSRESMKLAKDKLSVFGLTEKEIQAAMTEEGVSKARMTVRAIADGIVIKRGVVPGNFYDPKDDLMTIAPLDHLWVRGNVSEIDADKVQVGLALKVVFPYAHRTIPAKVEYIDKAIDPDTRAAKFRTSVLNPDRLLKAGGYVRVLVDIPPVPGQTVIPRVAMVSVDRHDYVFVRRPGTTDQFERRTIVVAKESNDQVIVAAPGPENHGIRPGEEVVTVGCLILEQMYEDRLMVEDGTLL